MERLLHCGNKLQEEGRLSVVLFHSILNEHVVPGLVIFDIKVIKIIHIIGFCADHYLCPMLIKLHAFLRRTSLIGEVV